MSGKSQLGLMTAILSISIVIYSLQILGNIMVTLLGFKTEGHIAGGVTPVLRLRVWPKLPRIGAGAQAMSVGHQSAARSGRPGSWETV